MPNEPPVNPQKDDGWSDVRSRYRDVYGGGKNDRWAFIKDRLALVAVILVLAFLVLMMIDGSIVNFRCSFAEFVTLECNRWTGEEHPSLQR